MNRINPLLNLGKKFVPQMVDGVWHSPAISARKKAELFKEWKYFGTIYGVQARMHFIEIYYLNINRMGSNMEYNTKTNNNETTKRS